MTFKATSIPAGICDAAYVTLPKGTMITIRALSAKVWANQTGYGYSSITLLMTRFAGLSQ